MRFLLFLSWLPRLVLVNLNCKWIFLPPGPVYIDFWVTLCVFLVCCGYFHGVFTRPKTIFDVLINGVRTLTTCSYKDLLLFAVVINRSRVIYASRVLERIHTLAATVAAWTDRIKLKNFLKSPVSSNYKTLMSTVKFPGEKISGAQILVLAEFATTVTLRTVFF